MRQAIQKQQRSSVEDIVKSKIQKGLTLVLTVHEF
jgi:D-Tyr-tRNAtyr deacylase